MITDKKCYILHLLNVKEHKTKLMKLFVNKKTTNTNTYTILIWKKQQQL